MSGVHVHITLDGREVASAVAERPLPAPPTRRLGIKHVFVDRWEEGPRADFAGAWVPMVYEVGTELPPGRYRIAKEQG